MFIFVNEILHFNNQYDWKVISLWDLSTEANFNLKYSGAYSVASKDLSLEKKQRTRRICHSTGCINNMPSTAWKLIAANTAKQPRKPYHSRNFCINTGQPVKYKIPPLKPIARTPKRLNNEPEKRPAKLKAQKKALVMKAIALVSAPILFKKSPNTKPNEENYTLIICLTSKQLGSDRAIPALCRLCVQRTTHVSLELLAISNK
uniref:Uncharacterized protein n=1 Tax=Glossina pallidipes TaxID=7398 RepID=A0A1A9ZB16_GLOPL